MNQQIKDKIKQKIYEHLLKEDGDMPDDGLGWLGEWPLWIPYNLYPTQPYGTGPYLPIWIFRPEYGWYLVDFSHDPPGSVRILEGPKGNPNNPNDPPGGFYWRPGMKEPKRRYDPVTDPYNPPRTPARPSGPRNPNPWYDPSGEFPWNTPRDPIRDRPDIIPKTSID